MENVKDWPAKEIGDQVELIRSKGLPTAPGEIHFSMQAFMKNSKGLSDYMRTIYQSPTNVPAMPWCGGEAPSKPSLSVENNVITFEPTEKEIRLFSVYEGGQLVGRIGDKTTPWTIPENLRNKNVNPKYKPTQKTRKNLESILCRLCCLLDTILFL